MPGVTQQRVARGGTSRAVPVVVSAGLAIGVFCGLLFGLGVEKDEAVAATVTTVEPPKKPDTVAAPFQPERKDVKVPSLAPQVIKKDGTTEPAKAGGGSDAKTEKPVEPPKLTKINGTLKFEIQPDDAAKVAKVTIDGKDIDGANFELDMTEAFTVAVKDLRPDAKKPEVKKELKIVVKASGFRDFTSKVDIVAERDTTLKVTMTKKSGGNVGGLPRPPPPGGFTRPPPNGGQKCKKPPCGLIDI